MQKWEYCFVAREGLSHFVVIHGSGYDEHHTDTEMERIFQKLGEAGWEAVYVYQVDFGQGPENRFLFKRPKE